MGVEVRKVETEIRETGVGQDNRVDVTYELGTELDGAWVRFASVTQSTVDAAKARAAAESETSSSGTAPAETPAETPAPTTEPPADAGEATAPAPQGDAG